MCKRRGVYGKGVDRSKPAVKFKNPVDKLTSTVAGLLYSATTIFVTRKTMDSSDFRIRMPGRSKRKRDFGVNRSKGKR